MYLLLLPQLGCCRFRSRPLQTNFSRSVLRPVAALCAEMCSWLHLSHRQLQCASLRGCLLVKLTDLSLVHFRCTETHIAGFAFRHSMLSNHKLSPVASLMAEPCLWTNLACAGTNLSIHPQHVKHLCFCSMSGPSQGAHHHQAHIAI